MTEQEWLECTDPFPMLKFLWESGSHRKLRLFAGACCRRVSQLLEYDQSRRAIDIAEQFAEGLVSEQQLPSIERATHETSLALDWGPKGIAGSAANRTVWGDARDVALRTSEQTSEAVSIAHGGQWADLAARKAELGVQSQLLRHIFGNPFRPVTLGPTWLTATVKHLAQTIYNDRAFDRMPILADALEEAGCTNEDILAHCRGPGAHVRGCWLVDLLLGKE